MLLSSLTAQKGSSAFVRAVASKLNKLRRCGTTEGARPPFPPFSREDALKKVRMAEDGWNARDPTKVSLAYTLDSEWRNGSTFIRGREEIVQFLSGKWEREKEYRLVKELFAYTGNRIAVRFQYEYQDANGQWHRAYGNENWEFADNGLMRTRQASINDVPIQADERQQQP
ncbi:unnamed protein product [Polarella glacialis]|uniref:Uncharacterized protein n=1 Tax=Polarella glacialis TaxID=89957 RepID=A0A813II28_POLGL|nr:unnamed protein product [Polarella glacialis]